jgi:adenosylhomocysteine nucleosidase
MFLRMLISHFAREAATRKLREVVDSEFRRRMTPDEQDGAPQEVPPCDVLVAMALSVESTSFVDRLERGDSLRCASFVEHSGTLAPQRVVVIETGVGREAAARAVDDAIAVHQPAWVVSAGFAAGLRDELRRGQMLMADRVADVRGGELSVGFSIDPAVVAANPALHVGRLVTVDAIVRTTKEKRLLAEQHDALACDMESAAVAEVCRLRQTRFLSVRVISDAVDDELPREIERLLAQDSLAGKLGAAAGALLGRPSAVKDFWKLRDQAFKSAERLATFLTGVLPQLTTAERGEQRP